jgi:hypothetical protein
MTETAILGFPEAACRLGVPLRVLREAIRTGKVAAPAKLTATSILTEDWLTATQAAVTPQTFSRAANQKEPPFARYAGTSCWRKYPKRVRAYNFFK